MKQNKKYQGQVKTETYTNSNNPCVNRGGNYNNSNNYTANRNNNNTSNSNTNIAFRSTLISFQIIYFKEYIQ